MLGAMAPLFSSPAIADLVLAVLLLEGIALAVWRRRTGRGPRPGAVLPFLVAGGCLVLALRAVLAGAAWPWTAAALVGALAAHLWQLRAAWGESGDGSG